MTGKNLLGKALKEEPSNYWAEMSLMCLFEGNDEEDFYLEYQGCEMQQNGDTAK